MTLDEAIAEANYKVRGRYTQLDATSSRYGTYRTGVSSAQRLWFAQPGVYWRSRRRTADLGRATAGTESYDAPDIKQLGVSPFDNVKISKTTDGRERELTLKIVEPSLLKLEIPDICSFYDGKLWLGSALPNSSPLLGGTIEVTHYLPPTLIDEDTPGSYVIEVDDAQWCVFMAARDAARAGYTKQELAPEFYAEAQKIMEKMEEVNSSTTREIPEVWRPDGRIVDY